MNSLGSHAWQRITHTALDYPNEQGQRQNRKELSASMELDGHKLRFVVIDPMHDLLLGMARHVF